MSQDCLAWSKRINNGFDEVLMPIATSNVTKYDYKGIIKALHDKGITGLRFDDERDGLKAGLPAQAMFAEALGRVPCGALGMSLTIHLDMVAPMVHQLGNTRQLKDILHHALRGRFLFSHAVTEPNAGSDIRMMKTTAVKKGDEWIINGTKKMISLAPIADYHFVLATVEGKAPPFNMVAFLIPKHAPGVVVGPLQRTLGNQACPVADIEFHNAKVSDSLRLGQAGMGFILQMQQFVQERILSSLRANEMAKSCLSEIIKHLKAREVAGKPIAQIDSIRHRIAHLTAELYQSQSATYVAMGRWINDDDYDSLSATCKLLSSRLAKQVTREAMQLGGVGHYQNASVFSGYFRDARLLSISTGSDEMMLKSIASSEQY